MKHIGHTIFNVCSSLYSSSMQHLVDLKRMRCFISGGSEESEGRYGSSADHRTPLFMSSLFQGVKLGN